MNKFYTTDKEEWKKLKKEFDKTMVAKNITKIYKTCEYCALLLILIEIVIAVLGITSSSSLIIILLLIAIMEIIARCSYYSFMKNFVVNSKEK